MNKTNKAKTCNVCGLPTTSKYGVCHREMKCRRVKARIWLANMAPDLRLARDQRRKAEARKRNANLTPEQRKRRRELWLRAEANLTPEERERRLRPYARLSPEQVARRRASKLKHFNRLTPEQREQITQRATHRRRLKGVRRKAPGESGSRWLGGRWCWCLVCSCFLGWRTPARTSPHGTFCMEHAKLFREYENGKRKDRV